MPKAFRTTTTDEKMSQSCAECPADGSNKVVSRAAKLYKITSAFWNAHACSMRGPNWGIPLIPSLPSYRDVHGVSEGLSWWREMPVSRTAVPLIAVVFLRELRSKLGWVMAGLAAILSDLSFAESYEMLQGRNRFLYHFKLNGMWFWWQFSFRFYLVQNRKEINKDLGS